MADELPQPEYRVFEFEVKLENVLVLTGHPAYKALGIPQTVINNEWFDINDQYELPTASQILGTIVRKKGYSGIIYTSVRSQTKNNLVIFEENAGELNFKKISDHPFDPTKL